MKLISLSFRTTSEHGEKRTEEQKCSWWCSCNPEGRRGYTGPPRQTIWSVLNAATTCFSFSCLFCRDSREEMGGRFSPFKVRARFFSSLDSCSDDLDTKSRGLGIVLAYSRAYGSKETRPQELVWKISKPSPFPRKKQWVPSCQQFHKFFPQLKNKTTLNFFFFSPSSNSRFQLRIKPW